MTRGQDLAPKRSRESTSKVRTGCKICKARRLKCDETKPICRRCAIGSRNCEYNSPPAAAPRNVITVYLPPIQAQPVLFADDPGLHFFRQNLAADLDGQFETKFWSKLVLQLSHSEPSVRHALSAISALYQDVESSLRHSAGYVKANPKAQKEWNGAVKSLSARIQAHPNSNLVPLVCCLLFTSIEFLRGNLQSSFLHVRSGFNILATLRCNSDASPGLGSNLSHNDLNVIEDQVVPIFSRLNVLFSLNGKWSPSVYTYTARESSPQEDLSDSRRRLYGISDSCIRFIGRASTKASSFQLDVDDLVEQVQLQARLEAWHHQLGELLQRIKAAGISVKQGALNMLLVHYKVVYIWIRVCTTAGEMATDAYYADFEELVNYAEQSTGPGAGMTTPQPLSFDMQILGPLYYTALKCRYPAIRRRAMEMLQWAPRREQLWNARYAFLTSKRVIELEERLLNGQGLPDESVRLHGLPLPDEESRLFDPSEMPIDFRTFGGNIVPSPTYPGTLEAIFRTKPRGLLGEWQTTTEYIKL